MQHYNINNTNQETNYRYEPEWYNENINMQSKIEIIFWCKVLNCEKNDLIKAVSEAGVSPRSVNNYLIRNNLKKN